MTPGAQNRARQEAQSSTYWPTPSDLVDLLTAPYSAAGDVLSSTVESTIDGATSGILHAGNYAAESAHDTMSIADSALQTTAAAATGATLGVLTLQATGAAIGVAALWAFLRSQGGVGNAISKLIT